MHLSIYSLLETDQETFINFWSTKYQYSLEYLYDQNIQKSFNENIVLNLFHWKNGMKLSASKLQSVRNNYIALLENLPVLNDIEQGRNFYTQLKGRIIWNLFWLHCINPHLFPIFDQHTYRACKFILNNGISELSDLNDNEKINFYFNTYIQFFNRFNKNEIRRIDKALFMFGRFLKKWK